MNETRAIGIITVFLVIFLSFMFPMVRTFFYDEAIIGEKTFKEVELKNFHFKDIQYITSRAVSKIEYITPEDNSIVNTTTVNLTWTVSGDQNSSVNFSVCVGESKDELFDKYISNNMSYVLKDLDNKKTYFWKIGPENEEDENFSESEVWSFTINKQVQDNTSLNVTSPAVEEKDYLPFIVGTALLIFVIIAFVFMRVKRRKSEKEMQEPESVEIDTVDAEIVHVPEPGEAWSDYGTQPVFEPELHGAMGNPLVHREERMPAVKDEVSAASVISLIKAMRMLRARNATAEQRDELGLPNIHLPTESELGSTTESGSEEVLMLPPPKVIEVEKEQQKVPIDELFLITPGGLLIQHYSLERESGLNEDVLAGMLTAVKSFISDSLSLLDKSADRESEINRIDFGKYSVLMYSGKTLSLVAITSHEEKERTMDQLKKCLGILEKRFGHAISEWDGDTSKVEYIKPYIEKMVRGELDTKDIPEE